MRLRFLIVASIGALVAAAFTPAAEPTASLAPPTKVFVLAGQSNMLGRGKPLSAGAPSDPRLLVWRGTDWQVASEPLGSPSVKVNGVGPGMTFGLETLNHLPTATIGIVMCATGGSKMTAWEPSGRPYQACIKQTRAAGGEVAGFIFLQGEGDARSRKASDSWSSEFGLMVPALRADLGTNVPIVIGQIPKLRDRDYPYQKNVRSQQVTAAAANTDTGLVSTIDLPVSPDGVHFTIDSYKAVGVRFADAWWQLAGTAPPPGPGPDFSLSSPTPTASVTQGQSAAFTISSTPQNGFSGTVSPSVAGLPSGASASFSPSMISSSGSSLLTVLTSASTPTGTYPLTVTGTSGFLSHITHVTLVVTSPTADFGLAIDGPKPSFARVGRPITISYRLTVISKFGFAGTVSISATGVPATTSGIFDPATLDVTAGDTAHSRFDVSTTAATPAGMYPITIEVTKGALTHTISVTLEVR